MAVTEYTAFIGTNSRRNSLGIYTVQIDKKTLKARIAFAKQAYNTGALALDDESDRLYAASEGMVFRGEASGGALAYSINGSGDLTEINEVPTVGQRPCSMAVDTERKVVYTANFFGGNVSVLPIRPDGGLAPLRLLIQEPKPVGWLHAMHAVGPLNGGRYIGAISLSDSEFVVYRAEDGTRVAQYRFGEKVFARSFAVSGDYIYAMLQDPGVIYVLRNCIEEKGTLELVQKISVQRPDYEGPFGTSAIRTSPNGRLLLAATRRNSTLSVFGIDPENGELTLNDIVELPGKTPRDFMISPDGKIVVTALQASDEICIHEIDYEHGTLRLRESGLHIPSPAAVVIRGKKE